MKTNYLFAPVTALNASPVTIVARDSRSPAISQKETKRTKARGVGCAFLLAVFLGLCVTTELHAQVVVVPNSLATKMAMVLTPQLQVLRQYAGCTFMMPLSLELYPGHPSSPNSPYVLTRFSANQARAR